LSITLKKRPGAGVPTPSPMHTTLFADENGNPSLKDSSGTVTPATNAGNPVQLNEQRDTPTPVGRSAKIYSKNIGGKTEVFSLNDAGEETQISKGGSVNNNSTVRWKDDVPGALYDATNTTPTFDDVVVVLINPITTLSGTGGKEGVSVEVGDRVLRACALSESEDQIANGVYIVAEGDWTRAIDANTGAKIQDSIVEVVVDPTPPSTAIRWAFWNPSGIPISVGVDPQNWVIVLDTTPTSVAAVVVVAVDNIPLSGLDTTVDDVLLESPYANVLAAGQTNPIQNGLYSTQEGSWTRISPWTTGRDLTGGMVVEVSGGTLYSGRLFISNNPFYRSVIVDVDPQYWGLLETENFADYGPVRVNVNFGDIVFGISVSPEVATNGYVILTLPPITPDSAGKSVTYIDCIGYKAIDASAAMPIIVLQPVGTDCVGEYGPGETVLVTSPYGSCNLISDGLGSWRINGSPSLFSPYTPSIYVPVPPTPGPS